MLNVSLIVIKIFELLLKNTEHLAGTFFSRVFISHVFFCVVNIWRSIMDRIENIGNAKKPFTASMHSTANLWQPNLVGSIPTTLQINCNTKIWNLVDFLDYSPTKVFQTSRFIFSCIAIDMICWWLSTVTCGFVYKIYMFSFTRQERRIQGLFKLKSYCVTVVCILRLRDSRHPEIEIGNVCIVMHQAWRLTVNKKLHTAFEKPSR